MNTQIISCKTIEYEVLKAIEETGCRYRVSWLASGLHNYPDRLRERVQELLDGICADRVLLAMGFCGNSLAGLATRDFELIFPRADDCITLLLGSPDDRRRHGHTYFLTKGWLEGERNIYEEYKYVLKKYGPRRGKAIFDAMLGHYQYLGLLDTGVCDFAALCEEGSAIALELGLELKQIRSPNRWLKALLEGPWPRDRFRCIPPNAVIGYSDLN